MLARIQRWIACSLLTAFAVTIVFGTLIESPWLIASVPIASFVAYALTLAIEFWTLRRSYQPNDARCPGIGDLVAAWKSELIAAPWAFLWRQPFFENAFDDDFTESPLNRRGVVFVHGFFCNRAVWNPWLKRLKSDGIPFVAVNMEPVFGSIDEYRKTIEAAVDRIGAATSLAPVVVAHSMGGLAVRAWLATRVDAGVVHRVVTIASPHGGTQLARRSIARNITDMRIGGPWLADLWARESPATRQRFICFWSHCDNIVFPTRTATLPEADNRHLPATAHVQMVLHPEIIETVLELVA